MKCGVSFACVFMSLEQSVGYDAARVAAACRGGGRPRNYRVNLANLMRDYLLTPAKYA